MVWAAGSYLSDSTDGLDKRVGLGEAIGGVIPLAIAEWGGDRRPIAGHLGLSGVVFGATIVLLYIGGIAGLMR